MPIEQTLEKIEQDIASKNYGKARDRLHGLIGTYPDNLTLRRQLGDIYWQLQYPAMAGRYWYLEEDRSPEMIVACKAFEHSCGYNSLQILQSLKFQGNLENINSVFAKNRLQTLQTQVMDEYGYTIDFQKQGAEKYYRSQSSRIKDTLWIVGCGIVILTAVVLMLVGFTTAVSWFF